MANRKIKRRGTLRSGGRSFVRNLGNRAGQPSVLLVCEDEKNSPRYFKSLCYYLKINSATVQIPPNIGSAPISVVDFAEEKYRRDGGYDRVFCVFDRDQHESFERAVRKVNSLALVGLPIMAVTAVPCFELWLLLHFERMDRPMRTCAEVIQRLRRHVPEFVKGESDIAEEILSKTELAVANARWLSRRQSAASAENPSTRIHELVTYLIGLKSPEL
ncbi:MAG: RloB family protein [Burkholderiales bacterium]